MDWERERCLALIEQYEGFPELWNPSHGLYYNKSRKHECWTLIATAMDSTTEEVKKKMESLLGSFRREKAKGTKIVGAGKAAHEMHVSRWFAFSKMAFLLERDQVKPHANNSITAADDYESTHSEAAGMDEGSPSQISHPDNDCSDLNTPMTLMNTVTPYPSTYSRMSRSKRRRTGPEDDGKLEETLSILRDAVNIMWDSQDECGVFGQHVANKLRNYDLRTRAMVQQEINTSLFNADMKLFPPPHLPTDSLNLSEQEMSKPMSLIP